ncbi:hypothetical protein [Bacillus sp. FJAT-45037]|uniref:hypothetical protein n=1 Tax=Bacillus sp. FJAT-45037 TaxID=2011007 RepID=UPI000C24D529|nr:hypothetical protein [Bacillus sp. FJAT-45037]
MFDIEEIDRPTSVVSAATPSFVTFLWIEKGFNGEFAAVNRSLGESKSTLLNELGEPTGSGTYEGGEYLTYGRTTYLFSKEDYRTQAITMDISDYGVTVEEMKRALGTPDENSLDELDGYWSYQYHLDEYTLFFEGAEGDNYLQFAWFMERKTH